MIIRKEAMMDQITDKLSTLETRVKNSNSMGLTDINSAAEDFYCGLLNIVLGGYHLKNLNLLQMDFPAIDLGDEENRLCVQVTSTEGREKVRSTLRKFFENDLHHKFDRLIVLIIGEKGNYRKNFDDEKADFDFDHTRDVWDTATLLQKINALELDRMAAVANYLHTALNIPDAPVPLHLPLHTSLGVDGFIGRQAELESLAQALRNGAKPILLSGLGGIGKTELASRFGQSYTKGRVYLASFQNSFRDTVTHSIARGIPNLLEKKLPEDEVYHTVMARLSQCPKDDILILDNVDRENGNYYDLLDDTYNSLCGLDLRLILTTRFEVAGAIEIKQLSNQELYQIFRKHKVNISTKEMDALIQAVDGHTLTIDLMARTMTGTWKKVTADMLLTALQEKDLPNKDYRRVPTDYNRTNRQERIYEHLRTVFNVAGVPEAARSVLCYATLLPQDGMDAETFGMALQEEEQQSLDDLINHGWLAVKDDTLTIHPVVRLVCREELKPSDEKCTRFLDAVWKQHLTFPRLFEISNQLAVLFANASEELVDQQGTWALRSGWHYHELGKYPNALEYEFRAVAIRENNDYVNAEDLATAYNNVGNSLGRMGENAKALEYQQKALTLLTNALPENHPDLATIHNNVGIAYGDLGDISTSLQHLQKAVCIHEKNPKVDQIVLAQAYSNLGLCYADCDDYNCAIKYLNKAMAILDNTDNCDYHELLILHNNLGGIYCSIGDRQKALSHQLKCIEILETTPLNNHPDSASIYHNIAMTFAYLNNLLDALLFEKKALDIAEQFYPSHNHHITIPKQNIGYMEKVLNSRKK